MWFLDFSSLLKYQLVLRKKDEKGNKFSWQDCKWLKYERQFGIISYKTSLNGEDNFVNLSLRRKGKYSKIINIPQTNIELLPISKEKKKDLWDLLELVPPVYHEFYMNLKTSDQSDLDPDLQDWLKNILRLFCWIY